MIGRVLKAVTGAVTDVAHALGTPDGVEYAVRLPDGTLLRDGLLKDRAGQEVRLALCQHQWPDAELVERPVWYGEWDPTP